jgi:molybdate transport system ATP-binding protein
LLRGEARGDSVAIPGGGELTIAERTSGDVYLSIPPNAVALHRAQPEGSPRNVWRGRVHGTDLLGDRVRVHVDGLVPLVAEVTPAAVAELGLHDGVEVWTSVKATEVAVYPV